MRCVAIDAESSGRVRRHRQRGSSRSLVRFPVPYPPVLSDRSAGSAVFHPPVSRDAPMQRYDAMRRIPTRSGCFAASRSRNTQRCKPLVFLLLLPFSAARFRSILASPVRAPRDRTKTKRTERPFCSLLCYYYSCFTGFASWMQVMASPFSRILPTSFRFFEPISTASSRTMFMYSSNPMICPSSCILVSSYSQMRTRVFFCKCPKMTLMGIVITFLTFFCGMVAFLRFAFCVCVGEESWIAVGGRCCCDDEAVPGIARKPSVNRKHRERSGERSGG
mmetsp:Transcript_23059/g.54496  ORF Transcript_23059/g.54496 Transcript_23059/m.54496 type:complete len:277 (+) Transcript_23059:109-939(+)